MLKSVRKYLLVGLFLVSGAVLAGNVDINTADAAAIAGALTNVGPAKAQAIIDYRAKHGPFKTLSDLQQVPGIGPKTIEANKDRITLSQPRPSGK